MFFPNGSVALPYPAYGLRHQEETQALGQWAQLSHLDLIRWVARRTEEVEDVMYHAMLAGRPARERVVEFFHRWRIRLSQDAERQLETLAFTSPEVDREGLAEEAYRLFSGMPDWAQAMPRDLEPTKRVFYPGRREGMRWTGVTYRPEVLLSEQMHALAFYRAVRKLRQTLPEEERASAQGYEASLEARIRACERRLDATEQALTLSWDLMPELSAGRLRDQAASRYRDWDRPAFEATVAQAVGALAGKEPSYGQTVAQDLGAEVLSYL